MKTIYRMIPLFLIIPFKSVAYSQSLAMPMDIDNRERIVLDQDGAQPAPGNQIHDPVAPAAPNEARDIDEQLDRAVGCMSHPCAIVCHIMSAIGVILFIKNFIG